MAGKAGRVGSAWNCEGLDSTGSRLGLEESACLLDELKIVGLLFELVSVTGKSELTKIDLMAVNC